VRVSVSKGCQAGFDVRVEGGRLHVAKAGREQELGVAFQPLQEPRDEVAVLFVRDQVLPFLGIVLQVEERLPAVGGVSWR